LRQQHLFGGNVPREKIMNAAQLRIIEYALALVAQLARGAKSPLQIPLPLFILRLQNSGIVKRMESFVRLML